MVPFVLQPKLGTRRAIFLSGMSGEEVSEVIGAYNDSGAFTATKFLQWAGVHGTMPVDSVSHDVRVLLRRGGEGGSTWVNL